MKVTSIILLCSCLLSIITFSSAADSIAAAQTLSDGQTIVSARGEFEMGFFSTKGNPKNRFFGVWYKKISNGTIIWVANRESPISNTSGVVKVSSRGIVVSINQSTDSIWTSNSSRSVKNPVAQLLDTGNLVFRDANEQQNFAWQSFDHPVDNFLPGMKFGYDLATGADRYFLPWKNEDDPAPGNYIHRVDKNGYPQLLLWKDSVPWYRTGPWIGSRFSGIPVLKPNGIYTPRFVITDTEVYYVFDLVNSSESSPITRLTLTPGGVSTRYIWNREKNEWSQYLTLQVSDCDRYGICGTNGVCNVNKSPRCECMEGFDPKNPEDWAQADWTNGCSRKVQLECGNGDGFLKYTGVKLPDTRWSWYNMSMNLVECEEKCLKDCNCTAYSNTDIRDGGSGCLLWFGGVNDMRGYSDDGQDLFVRMPKSELKGNKHSGQKTRVWTVLIPVFAVLAGIVCLFLLYRIRKKRIRRAETVQLSPFNVAATNTEQTQEFDLPLLDFIQIANATDNFSYNNKLGEGGFGAVYKGVLDEGQEIAVKRLSKDSRQGVNEFMNEVSCIAKLQHRNLVRLIACCIEEGERMLVYEYMPNKGLDSFIFDKEKCKSFDWPKRYNIINGIARGLLYLHQDSRLRIIHRDLKASNILLDYEMNPKISDFGLARIFGGSETQASTTRVVGTYGYMPPEYAIDGLFSIKSDVYSFGVLLLEIISGKKNRGFHHPDHNLNLVGHTWRSYNENNLLDIADKVILDSSNEHEVFRVVEIGLLCVQEYPEDRPNMSSVVLMLSSKIALPKPKQPGFYSERRKPNDTTSSSTNHTSSSNNSYSVSFFAPR
ncbi:Receptor-like serine/threonine-protein kinase [Heracleum sosnowskyi]|uniref:Receptor-like serine/threonine-protein kinase n=1 Tax=Heracleum sosnowskyi TaxID=360622 RepID=A0AAD8N049_9APIA|nr:Receptor-like serine/threonine-protein kinase [Heracleum sosnowskyi]